MTPRSHNWASVSSVTPFLLETEDNTDGIDSRAVSGMRDAIGAGRPASSATFLHDFFTAVFGPTRVSERAIDFH